MLLLFLLAIGVSTMHAQLVEVPIQYNHHLQEITSRSLQLEPERRFYVPRNGRVVICADQLADQQSLASVDFAACTSLTGGQFVVDDNCVTYLNRGQLLTDQICATLCDTNGICQDFTLSIEARALLAIPFVDDFSYTGPYPDEALWLDRDVYINFSLAEKPLGLGVATFDGLDPNGTPYDRTPGLSDLLTSGFIDASTARNVYVSFFVQPRGFGIRPRVIDSLALDVRTPQHGWRRVWSQPGLPNDFTRFQSAPPFEFVKIAIPDSLLHEAFQIRFRNRSEQLGLQQLWHIDYVQVTEDIEPEVSFEDIAFRAVPSGILRHYTAMPYRHFLGFEDNHVRDSFDISLYNHFPGVNNANPSELSILRNDGRTLADNLALLLPGEISPDGRNQRNLGAGPHDFRNGLRRSTVLDAVRGIAAADTDLGIMMQYSFQQDRESNQGIAAFLRNNTTTFTNRFENFFAYDDGTAESGLKAENNTGVVTVAVEYTCNVPDQLQGVQFFFPRVEGDADRLRFDLMIWLDSLSGEPDYLQEAVQPLYADQFFDTLQGYTTYPLLDELGERTTLDLPEGKFYIGWRQVRSTVNQDLSVGFDKNRPDAADFIYMQINNGAWRNVGETIQTIQGALMIRPILDDQAVIPTSADTELAPMLTVFPNPSNSVLFLDGPSSLIDNGQYQIFSVSGHLLREGPSTRAIDLSGIGSGSYLLVLSGTDRLRVIGRFQVVK